MEELKNCPTCGRTRLLKVESTFRYDRISYQWTAKVTCLDCFTSSTCHGFESTEEKAIAEAIKVWQSRPIEDALQRRIDDLESKMKHWKDVLG
jgi:hypothetical protein